MLKSDSEVKYIIPKSNPVKDSLFAGLAVTMRAEWERLVDFAMIEDDPLSFEMVLENLSKSVRIGKDSLKRKFDAIRYMAALGHSAEDIKQAGQEHVVGRWNKSRQEKHYGNVVSLGWRIPGSQKAVLEQEVARVKSVLKLQTSEQFVDWWIAQMHNATEAELLASAGESDAQKKS